MLSILIQGVIVSLYPGGAEAFNKDFATFMCSDNTFVIAPREYADFPEEVLDKLQELGEAHDLQILLTETSNFQGVSEKEAEEMFNNDMKTVLDGLRTPLKVSASAALLDVECEELEKDSDDAKRMMSALTDITYLKNIRIAFLDEVVYILDGELPATEEEKAHAKKYSHLCTGRPDRDAIISQDDVMDVTIALGRTNSVEEFLVLINGNQFDKF